MNAASGISFLAPAKLNISLKVYGRRPDGYHDIRSVMVPVSLYDEVTVQEAARGISIESSDPSVPVDETNTCHKAAAAFIGAFGSPGAVRIRIRKAIPAEAGLGGGSSDAAATLKGLAALCGRNVPAEALRDIAEAVGADVPFFLAGGPALAEGKGELLSPVAWEVPFWAAIVKPSFGLSTRDGYARLGRGPGDPPPRGDAPSFRRWDDVVSEVSNDFEGAWGPVRPEIGRIKAELQAAGAFAAGLTGSGSAVFGLFGTERDARGALAAPGRANGRRQFVARNI